MKKVAVIILPLLIALGCADNDANPCNVDNYLTDLPWLKQLVEQEMEMLKTNPQLNYSYIIQGNYKGQVVFLKGSCCPFCLWLPVYYNCAGEVVEVDDMSNVKDTKVIWTAEGALCSFK